MQIMKRVYLLLLAVLTIYSCKKDENVCETDRYSNEIFTEVSRTNITYATVKGVDGKDISLSMDIYQPTGDEFEKRPLLILAHGGSFIGGSRLDMQQFAQTGARRGFVTASIDYRLLSLSGGIPDSSKLVDIAIKASHDMRAAVRFFRKSVSDGNIYKIDSDNIFIGGVSAGAITALHAGLLDETDPVPAIVKNTIANNGGIQGNSSNAEALKFSSEVKGILNLSGAVITTDIIDAKDPSIYSYHGDKDEVVPYEFGFASVGPVKITRLYGSKLINEKAKSLGIKSELTTVSGGGHTDVYLDAKFLPQLTGFTTQTYSGVKGQICGG